MKEALKNTYVGRHNPLQIGRGRPARAFQVEFFKNEVALGKEFDAKWHAFMDTLEKSDVQFAGMGDDDAKDNTFADDDNRTGCGDVDCSGSTTAGTENSVADL